MDGGIVVVALMRTTTIILRTIVGFGFLVVAVDFAVLDFRSPCSV